MRLFFKLLPIGLLLCLTTLSLHGQSRVILSREQDRNNPQDYIIYANNPTGEDQHVVVIFTDIVGYRPNVPSPPAINIGTGRTKLFTLKRDELTSGASFQYEYYTFPGVANPKIKEVEYVLPIVAGKKVSVSKLTDARLKFGETTSENTYYGLAFKGEVGDTISAIRGGVVRKIVQNQETEGNNVVFSSTKNYMEVKHADGTVARYDIFQNESAMVAEGDVILAGDPLALFTGENYQMGPNFRLSIRYLTYTYTKALRSNEWYANHYLVPKFRTGKEGLKELEGNYTYLAVLNDDLVTQEMSRRQKKAYLKAKR